MQGTEIDLKDGKRHVLSFGVRAAAMLEHEFGDVPFATILTKGISVRFLSVALWAGLQKSEPSLSHEQVCELIDGYLAKTPDGSYLDLLRPISDAGIEGNLLRRIVPGEDPNAGKEAESPAPSPNGGETDSRQSSDITDSRPRKRAF